MPLRAASRAGLSAWAGGIAARLYDKALEIKKSGKLYLLELWAQAGYREGDPVWRLEFQFKRAVLSQLGVVALGSVLNQLNGLWGYAMADWLRLTLPNPDDKTRSRWPVHPLWGYLSSVDWETNGGPLLRQYPLARVPGDDKLFPLYFSALISYMAREGINDLYQGQESMTAAVVAYYMRKADWLGLSFERYVDERVATKARLFNSLVNDDALLARIDAEDLVAQAEAYRKASRG
jgi:hypothetical protein